MTTGRGAMRIWAVVVTWRPERDGLAALLAALAPQVDGLVVVDNGSGAETQDRIAALLASLPGGRRSAFLPLGANGGLGAAQGEGIARALEEGATHLLLSDQDSLPEPDMVAELAGALARLKAEGVRVAAVGPVFVDEMRPRATVFARFTPCGLQNVKPDPATGLAEVDYVITSGALIPAAALALAGPPSAELFIDLIDMDWGYRARAAGLRSFGVAAARMRHRIGEGTVPFLGRRVAVHGPERGYYELRNYLHLLRAPHMPWTWAVHFGLRVGFVALLMLAARPDRARRLRLLLRALRDGATGRLGPLGGS